MPLVWAWSIRTRTKSLRTFSCSALYRQVIGYFSEQKAPATQIISVFPPSSWMPSTIFFQSARSLVGIRMNVMQ